VVCELCGVINWRVTWDVINGVWPTRQGLGYAACDIGYVIKGIWYIRHDTLHVTYGEDA